MFATIWTCTQEWSLISRRTTAFTFATCHQALSCLSASIFSRSRRSLRFPRGGTRRCIASTASDGREQRRVRAVERERLLDHLVGIAFGRHRLSLRPHAASAAQSPYRRVYGPSAAMSSSCVPCSTIRPWSSTTIRSARRMVESRCAMTKAVRPARSRLSPFSIRRSVPMSTDEVASSRIRMRGFASRARAKATSWRWPSESRNPRSPSSVS